MYICVSVLFFPHLFGGQCKVLIPRRRWKAKPPATVGVKDNSNDVDLCKRETLLVDRLCRWMFQAVCILFFFAVNPEATCH